MNEAKGQGKAINSESSNIDASIKGGEMYLRIRPKSVSN